MATLVAPIVRKKRADDIFFTSMSVLMLAIIVVGFAPSYFLRGAVFAHLPSLLVHLHGAVFSSWIFLFVIQSSLVSAGNIRLHRKLGVLGAFIAGLMVILGVLTPLGTIHRAAHLPSFFTNESFLVGNIFGILIFGAYVAFAIWKRNNRIVHKRMMLMANAMLMSPSLSRMPFMDRHPYLIGLIPLGMVVALFIFDLFTQKRVLAVTVIGGILFWAADPVSDWLIAMPFSHQLVLWLSTTPKSRYWSQPSMATLVARPVKTRTDDIYFVGISIAMLITVVAGFSQSYFFKGMFLAPLHSTLLHFHGAAFSAWIILFVVQTLLVARRNLPLHRKLGYAGAALAFIMVTLGITATLISVHEGRTPSIFTPPMFLVLNIYGVLIFGTFVALAVIQRNNRPIHKRLMLLATLNLLPPATTRLFVFILHKPSLNTPVLLAFTLSLIVFDLISRRKPYAVTVIGSLIVLSVFPMANALGHLAFMQQFAAYVLRP